MNLKNLTQFWNKKKKKVEKKPSFYGIDDDEVETAGSSFYDVDSEEEKKVEYNNEEKSASVSFDIKHYKAFAWWQYTILIIEIFLVIYAILVLTGSVPIF